MNEKQKQELLILIESLVRNATANDGPGAACVRAEIHRRLAAVPAPAPTPAPALAPTPAPAMEAVQE